MSRIWHDVESDFFEPAQGTWTFGKRHGYGAYIYTDNGVYEGQWVDDKVRFNHSTNQPPSHFWVFADPWQWYSQVCKRQPLRGRMGERCY